MKKSVLIGLIEVLVAEAVSKYPIPDPIPGPRGRDGKNGQDFNFEDHRDEILSIIKNNIPKAEELIGPSGRDGKDFNFEEYKNDIFDLISKSVSDSRDSLRLKFEDLTDKEKEFLKGDQGLPGKSGRDGKDFDIEDNKNLILMSIEQSIEAHRDSLRLKFEDLTDKEKESLKGDQGSQGREGKPGIDGKDFIFEEHQEKIESILKEYFDSVSSNLKLKFSDLTDEEKLEIKGSRGEKGDRGLDGKDFIFEEHEEKIKSFLPSAEDLKLKFQDLTKEEVDSLKLKFSDLTDDEIHRLRGPRGQKGARGAQGIQGEQGIPGENGKDGKDGRDGKDFSYEENKEKIESIISQKLPKAYEIAGKDGEDGKDAPVVEDVRIESDNKEFSLVFYFSDGSRLKTNSISIPTKNSVVYASYGFSTSEGGGGTGSSNYYKDDVLIGSFSEINFTGNVELSEVGGKLNINIPDQGITVKDEGSSLGKVSEIDFTGDIVTVTETSEGKVLVEINQAPASADLTIKDEGNVVTSSVKRMNFIGDYVKVRPVVPMSEWDLLSNVEPSLEDYVGSGNAEEVEVVIDIPDSSILKNIDCDASVFVGAFVYIDINEVARNALADTYSNSNVIGLVESKESSEKCDIRVSGISKDIYSGLDPSLEYFLSDTNPGMLTTTVPNTPGHIKLVLGQSFGSKKFLMQKGERVVAS